MALPDGLLEAAKNHLDMTWTLSAGETAKLEGNLARGIKYLDSIAGETLHYTEEGAPRGLLLDYVRYARSNALDEFAGNYQHELLRLQMDCQIARQIAVDEAAEGGDGA